MMRRIARCSAGGAMPSAGFNDMGEGVAVAPARARRRGHDSREGGRGPPGGPRCGPIFNLSRLSSRPKIAPSFSRFSGADSDRRRRQVKSPSSVSGWMYVRARGLFVSMRKLELLMRCRLPQSRSGAANSFSIHFMRDCMQQQLAVCLSAFLPACQNPR